ncbi:MAG TPA: nitroreductase family protein [Phycisphaerae bacterium]|nr:nitroreductase family protein [Phycisphaerae bacterium]HSA29176.1 nitroreductase family protein [Phycisphaerae bacterium]
MWPEGILSQGDQAVSRRAPTDHPIHEILAQRWSPCGFAETPVLPEHLKSLFRAARWAASSYNEQPWRHIVATRDDPEVFDQLLSYPVEANQAWARFAPVLAVGIAKRTFARNGAPNRVALHDLGAATARRRSPLLSLDLRTSRL